MSIHDKYLDGSTKYDIAIKRIKSFCAGKRVLCAFSGGKDSQACYHLCKDAGIDFSAQYSITRFEPPELISFIRQNYPDVVFRRAFTRSLVEEIKVNGLPTRWHRFCCKAKHKKTPGFDIVVVGVRWEESPRRRDTWRMSGSKEDGVFYICPICDWTTREVWEYLNEREIPHCCLYDQGFSRIGCVCCPLAPNKMRADAKRWPKTANMLHLAHLKNWEYKWELVNGKRNGRKFQEFIDFETADEAFEYWLDTGCLIKSKSAKSVDEPCLFAGTGFSESDGDQ